MDDAKNRYIACLRELKVRFVTAHQILDKTRSLNRDDFDTEVVALQIRKCLELIAFSSLVANKDKYAAHHAQFALDWSAKKLLARLEVLHSDFYPIPIQSVPTGVPNTHHFEPQSTPTLTKAQFVELYDVCSQVMHVRNPFYPNGSTVDLKRSFKDWLGLIESLLTVHRVVLVDREESWIVQMKNSDDGDVHLFSIEPYRVL